MMLIILTVINWQVKQPQDSPQTNGNNLYNIAAVSVET